MVLDEDEEEYQVVLQIDTSVIATYRVRYNVEDSSGNDALEVIRTVKVEDTTIPVITLTGESEITIFVGSGEYEDERATALDNIDGVITENIVVIYELVINEEEEYGVVEEIVH
ncbi:MAG: hypothetical protein PHX04_02720 [Bacilli bacterium]|nr:hypothetical protein [Bacilli bacterium]